MLFRSDSYFLLVENKLNNRVIFGSANIVFFDRGMYRHIIGNYDSDNIISINLGELYSLSIDSNLRDALVELNGAKIDFEKLRFVK